MMLGVSIIHGARRIQENSDFRPSWPKDLAIHIGTKHAIISDYFVWNGGLLTSITDETIDSYAQHLIKLYSNLGAESQQEGIIIIGKSLGAIIAELALERIDQDGEVDLKVNRLIRVATPDWRKFIYLNNVKSIIDIYSIKDMLYMISIIPLSICLYIFRKYKSSEKVPIINYKITGLSHGDFNKNIKVTLDTGKQIHLYDLYALITTSKIGKMDFESKPAQKKSCR